MVNKKRLIDANEELRKIQAVLDENKHQKDTVAYRALEAFMEGLKKAPTVDAVEVVHGRWEDGICSNCKKEALSTSWDEPIYDYDWEENLRYSYTETHTEHILTDYCPNCGAKMRGNEE